MKYIFRVCLIAFYILYINSMYYSFIVETEEILVTSSVYIFFLFFILILFYFYAFGFALFNLFSVENKFSIIWFLVILLLFPFGVYIYFEYRIFRNHKMFNKH